MADLHIIGSGGIEFNGLGMIYRRTSPTAVVGAGGIDFGGAGVVAFLTPGVTAIIGSGGIEFAGGGVIEFTIPPLVLGSGGIEFGGQGIIAFLPPKTTLHVGSGGIQFAGQGVIGVSYPRPPSVLAIVGTGGMVFGGAGVVAFSKPPVLAIIGSGGMQFGDFRVAELTVVKVVYPADLTLAAITGVGGVEFGGTGVITFKKPQVYATPTQQTVADANIFFGGSGIIAFIHPQILQVIGDGGIILGEPVATGIFATYVLTGVRGEPSLYSGFDFNSYAKFRGQYFGAGEDGIYLLEGSDDAGEAIHSGVRIGPANFGTDREKRLRLLRCGGKSVGAQVKVSNGNGSAGYYDVEDGRAAVSREVQGRELTIEIADFETLDHLEIVPLVLHKR